MKPAPELIESRLAELDPAIEFLAIEPSGPDGFRLVLDHPDGVTLELCERVTGSFPDLLAEHALEVASPGPERPLTNPSHFERFRGRRAKVTTLAPIDGRRNFTGTIMEADPDTVGIECDATLFRIPHDDIKRAHLVPETPEGAAK
ncbi:MAG: ribosome maturation factor RimP [Solirubrobacterales bacterium]|nr:ribosome maturation factor RimP [Solirubrobacterales bacterium]